MKVNIIGTGYVGLVTGVCLAEVGHEVVCIDVDKEKIKTLNKGISPIYEHGLEQLMKKNKKRLTFTESIEEAYQDTSIVMIAVGTPEKEDGSVNLNYVYDAALNIAKYANQDCLIVIKSTVPIGTNYKIGDYIKKHLVHPIHIEIASNPEFLSQGRAVQDTLYGYRIVIGTQSSFAENLLKTLYDPFKQPIVSTDITSAELIKYASNSFLSLKISYVNELANLCEKLGGNIEDVSYGMGLDTRIGNQFLNAGIGYGGSCFPKDTKALYWLSELNGYNFKTVGATIEVNKAQQLVLLEKIKRYYPSIEGLTLALLGLTFKPETDDLREAPSLKYIEPLLKKGASLKAYDPVGISNYQRLYPTELTYCYSIEETLADADLCLIFTEWPQIKSFEVAKFRTLMKKAIILDGRNCYTLAQFANFPVIYDSIGRSVVNQLPKK